MGLARIGYPNSSDLGKVPNPLIARMLVLSHEGGYMLCMGLKNVNTT